MKKVISVLFFIMSFYAYSEMKTFIRFEMNDGSPIQEINIEYIENISIKQLSNNLTMTVYYKSNSNIVYKASDIDTINFSTDGNNQKLLNIYISGNIKKYLVSDIDIIIFKQNQGNNETVTIGTQVWMTKNLDVAYYRNGDAIHHAVTYEEWNEAGILQKGAWCYNNNNSENGAVYGKLYNGYAVNDPRGLAPSGWHVASEPEWTTLISYLMNNRQFWCNRDKNKIAKSLASRELWFMMGNFDMCAICDVINYNNKSGFTALPGGYRSYEFHGLFVDLTYRGYWWTSNKDDNQNSCVRLYFDSPIVQINDGNKSDGYSVRCLKD